MNKPVGFIRPSRTCVNCLKNGTLACAQGSKERMQCLNHRHSKFVGKWDCKYDGMGWRR